MQKVTSHKPKGNKTLSTVQFFLFIAKNNPFYQKDFYHEIFTSKL